MSDDIKIKRVLNKLHKKLFPDENIPFEVVDNKSRTLYNILRIKESLPIAVRFDDPQRLSGYGFDGVIIFDKMEKTMNDLDIFVGTDENGTIVRWIDDRSEWLMVEE